MHRRVQVSRVFQDLAGPRDSLARTERHDSLGRMERHDSLDLQDSRAVHSREVVLLVVLVTTKRGARMTWTLMRAARGRTPRSMKSLPTSPHSGGSKDQTCVGLGRKTFKEVAHTTSEEAVHKISVHLGNRTFGDLVHRISKDLAHRISKDVAHKISKGVAHKALVGISQSRNRGRMISMMTRNSGKTQTLAGRVKAQEEEGLGAGVAVLGLMDMPSAAEVGGEGLVGQEAWLGIRAAVTTSVGTLAVGDPAASEAEGEGQEPWVGI